MDRSELEQQVVAGEKAREALSRLQSLDSMDDELAELRSRIAALEAESRFGEAAPLKVEQARLVSRRGAP